MTTLLEPKRLVEFLDELRASGWEIGVEQYVAAENALLAFNAVASHESDNPATWLAPVVCCTAIEQDEFHDRFRHWWHQREQPIRAQSPDHRPDAGEATASTPSPRRRLAFALLILGLFIAVALFVRFNPFSPGANVQNGVPGEPIANSPNATGRPESDNQPSNGQPVAQAPSTVATSPSASVRAILSALPMLAFFAWFVYRQRGPASLRRLHTYHTMKPIELKVTGPSLFDSEFRQAAQKLRRHRATQATELAPGTTVEATLRAAGWFTPVYAVRQVVPEYLVLVDIASRHDQQAKLQDEIVKHLIADGVFVDRYYFAKDPRICWPQGSNNVTVALQEIGARHRDHVLILFTDAEGFTHPVTGATQSWLDAFQEWPERVILTPAAPSQWGYRESALREAGFLVCPATPSGITAFVEARQRGIVPSTVGVDEAVHKPELLQDRPTRWLDDHEPSRPLVDQLCRDLRSALGESGFLWLAACAVYPILQWDLTLYLGRRVCFQSKIDTALVALVRLPWFRQGRMPDWLRLRLIAELSRQQEAQVRHTLQELLLTSLADEDSGFVLRVVHGPEWRARHQMRALLSALLRRQPDDSPLNDHVFLSFLGGRKPRKLVFTLPDLLRRALLTKGLSTLGLRPTAALTIAVALTLLAWRPFATTLGAQAFAEGNALYNLQQFAEAAVRYEQAITQCRANDDDCTVPTLTPVYFYLGNSYDNLFRPERRFDSDNDAFLVKAIENYQKSVDLEKNPQIRLRAMQYLAAAFGPEKLNDPAKAEPVVRWMIELYPNESVNYVYLARLYEDAGDFEQAEQVLIKARDVNPSHELVYMSLADFYKRRGEFDKTIEALRARAQKAPNNPEAYYAIAAEYWDKASRDFTVPKASGIKLILAGLDAVDKAIELKPDYFEALSYKNLLLRAQAKLEKNGERQQALLREADMYRDRAKKVQDKRGPQESR